MTSWAAFLSRWEAANWRRLGTTATEESYCSWHHIRQWDRSAGVAVVLLLPGWLQQLLWRPLTRVQPSLSSGYGHVRQLLTISIVLVHVILLQIMMIKRFIINQVKDEDINVRSWWTIIVVILALLFNIILYSYVFNFTIVCCNINSRKMWK